MVFIHEHIHGIIQIVVGLVFYVCFARIWFGAWLWQKDGWP